MLFRLFDLDLVAKKGGPEMVFFKQKGVQPSVCCTCTFAVLDGQMQQKQQQQTYLLNMLQNYCLWNLQYGVHRPQR